MREQHDISKISSRNIQLLDVLPRIGKSIWNEPTLTSPKYKTNGLWMLIYIFLFF
jgi:hypothetical protein